MKKSCSLVLAVVALGVLSGCAGTAPTAEFKKPISDAMRLCMNDDATVTLSAADGVMLNDVSRQRLESRLTQTINEKKKLVQCKTADKRVFALNSKITRYDEGNAFARAMLAGLGQIHIDGEFVLTQKLVAAAASDRTANTAISNASASESVAEFTVQKTFAWGGLYGSSNRIDDVEPGFAEGVTDAIVAQVDVAK